MTDQEWAAIELELDHTFVGDFGPKDENDLNGFAQVAAYKRHLAHLDYGVLSAAIALIVEDGKPFLPRPPELRLAVQRVTAEPQAATWAEAWEAFTRAAKRHRGDNRAIVAAVAEEAGEGAARWVAARTPKALLAEMVDGDGAEGRPQGGAVRHRLAQEFERFAEAAREDGRVGRALERVRQGELESGRPSGPRPLDAAAALGLPKGGGA